MCDHAERLVAWLDGELGNDEMADVERHTQICMECRRQLESYEQMSKSFNAYCDAVSAATMRRRLPGWVPVVSATAAVAATVAATLFLALQPARVERVALAPAVVAAPPAISHETAPAPIKTLHQRHASARVGTQAANWLPAEPAIEIAIPAESMFPPGALPDGVNFTADLSLAADGSAQQIRLRPRLIRFERRTTQP